MPIEKYKETTCSKECPKCGLVINERERYGNHIRDCEGKSAKNE
jgi:uncharacterized C2H2 Zn-finger protein